MITNTRTIHSFNYFGNNVVFNGDTYEVKIANNDTFTNLLEGYHLGNNNGKSSLQNKETDQTMDQDKAIREFYCQSSNEVQQITLNLTNQCNLRCSYCFNQYKQNHSRQGKMQSSTAFKAIDYLMAGNKKNKGVSFFGGEPLLNFTLMKQVVGYAIEKANSLNKTLSFCVTTNGTLLTKDICRFLDHHNFTVIISLDGNETIHNRNRKYPNGRGSYNKMLQGLNNLKNELSSLNKVIIRGTFVRNSGHFTDSFKHLASLGFKNISLEPAAGHKNNENIFQLDDLSDLTSEYTRLALEYQKVNADKNNIELFQLVRLIRRITNYGMVEKPCGAANGFISIAPNGDIYPCHRIMSQQYRMGNIEKLDNFNQLDKKIQENFDNSKTSNKPYCMGCWAKKVCGGTCHATNVYNNKEITEQQKLECELFKTQLEMAIGTLVKRHIEEGKSDDSKPDVVLKGRNCIQMREQYGCDDRCDVSCDEYPEPCMGCDTYDW